MRNSESSKYLKILHQQVLETATSAIKYNRYILLLVVIISVLGFIGYWNSLESGWIRLRHQTATELEKLVRLHKIDTIHQSIGYKRYMFEEHILKKNVLYGNKYDSLIFLFQDLDQKELFDQQLVSIAPTLYKEGRLDGKTTSSIIHRPLNESYVRYLAQRELWPKVKTDFFLKHTSNGPIHKFINIEIERLEKALLENVVLIRLPFFGIVLDINDLSLLTGLTFIILLSLLVFTHYREKRNIEILFDVLQGILSRSKEVFNAKTNGFSKTELKKAQKEFTRSQEELKVRLYQLVSLNNLITMSPQLRFDDFEGEREKEEQFFRPVKRLFMATISKVVYLIPIAVQALILSNDLNTTEVGILLGAPDKVENLIAISIGLLSIVSILCLYNLFLAIKMEYFWNQKAKKFKSTWVYGS